MLTATTPYKITEEPWVVDSSSSMIKWGGVAYRRRGDDVDCNDNMITCVYRAMKRLRKVRKVRGTNVECSSNQCTGLTAQLKWVIHGLRIWSYEHLMNCFGAICSPRFFRSLAHAAFPSIRWIRKTEMMKWFGLEERKLQNEKDFHMIFSFFFLHPLVMQINMWS